MERKETFPHTSRIKERSNFIKLKRQGKRVFGVCILMEFFFREQGCPRLGITVSRHFGKAHERNYFKRVVREAFRQCQHLLPQGLDVNVKPNRNAKKISIDQVIQDLLSLKSL